MTNPYSINKFSLFPALNGRGKVLQYPLITDTDSSAILPANILPSGVILIGRRPEVSHIRSEGETPIFGNRGNWSCGNALLISKRETRVLEQARGDKQ